MSRTISNDHLSPKMSSDTLTGHPDRLPVSPAWLRDRGMGGEISSVTCIKQVVLLPSMDTMPNAGELPELSRDELLRYSRHLILPEVGAEGQRRLKAARVLCVGAGGLGSPLLLYLAAAGIGAIGIVDFDRVDASNLHRQIIHATPDVGRSKLDSAADRIAAINPNVQVRRFETKFTSANALDIIRDFDVVADGTDNFPTRYLVNDACVLSGKPNVYASIFRFDGQASVFHGRKSTGAETREASLGPCYRCLYPEPPPPGAVPSCAEGGVLGVLPGLLGVLQATEVIKIVVGIGEPLIGRLLLVDALTMRFREVKVKRDPECRVCGDAPTVHSLIDYEEFCGLQMPLPPPGSAIAEISVAELKRKRDAGERFVLLDVREPHEFAICNLGGRLIPLGDLPNRLSELDPSTEIVVHCKSGGRSARAADLLRNAGFPRVINLTGGILAWSEQIDPSVPRY